MKYLPLITEGCKHFHLPIIMIALLKEVEISQFNTPKDHIFISSIHKVHQYHYGQQNDDNNDDDDDDR